MDEKNVTMIKMIQLLGIQFPQNIQFGVFILFLLIYCATICGNLLIITVVSYSETLHTPMYFLLSQLSVLDILLATDILPKMLQSILVKDLLIPLSECITQFSFFAISETSECLLLTVMSYDRYVAICKPLHYVLVMTHQACWKMVITSWTLATLIVLNDTLTISHLQFCGPNVIDHFFCDLEPILKLSCSDTAIIRLEVMLLSSLFILTPFFIVIVSYIYIIITIYKIPSITGRKKVFSTCSSHLMVISIFYVTLVCIYLVPRKGQSGSVAKFLSLLYTVLTPLLNPLIYSLRNQELKCAAGKVIHNFLKYVSQ